MFLYQMYVHWSQGKIRFLPRQSAYRFEKIRSFDVYSACWASHPEKNSGDTPKVASQGGKSLYVIHLKVVYKIEKKLIEIKH